MRLVASSPDSIRARRREIRSEPRRSSRGHPESRRPTPDPTPPRSPSPYQHVAKLAAAASGAPPADAPADPTPEAAAPEAAAADVPTTEAAAADVPTTADVPPPPPTTEAAAADVPTTADVPPPPPTTTDVPLPADVPPPPPAADDAPEPDGGEHAVLVCGDVCVDDASVAAAVASACATPPLTVALLSRGAAAVTFPDERAARAAVAAFAANPNLNLTAETLRRTLWPDEEAACDVRKTEVLVAGVPETIGDDAVRQVMGTYGAVSTVRRDGGTTRVTMATREGAETATAALSGVYKFEEAQPTPVVVTWCEPEPEPARGVRGGGGWRQREDGDNGGAAADGGVRGGVRGGVGGARGATTSRRRFPPDGDARGRDWVFPVGIRRGGGRARVDGEPRGVCGVRDGGGGGGAPRRAQRNVASSRKRASGDASSRRRGRRFAARAPRGRRGAPRGGLAARAQTRAAVRRTLAQDLHRVHPGAVRRGGRSRHLLHRRRHQGHQDPAATGRSTQGERIRHLPRHRRDGARHSLHRREVRATTPPISRPRDPST